MHPELLNLNNEDPPQAQHEDYYIVRLNGELVHLLLQELDGYFLLQHYLKLKEK